MLLYTQGWINRRTGWASWFINVFLLFLATLTVMAILLATTNPSGLKSGAFGVLIGVGLGIVIALAVAVERWVDQKEKTRKQVSQPELWEEERLTFISHFLWNFRYTVPTLIAFGLFLGFIVGLTGE